MCALRGVLQCVCVCVCVCVGVCVCVCGGGIRMCVCVGGGGGSLSWYFAVDLISEVFQYCRTSIEGPGIQGV